MYKGIFEYKDFIDNNLDENANYFRIWTNVYDRLFLQGPSIVGNQVVNDENCFFNNSMNQKSAKELDEIIEMARIKDKNIMFCIYPSSLFRDSLDDWDINQWCNNPYKTIVSSSEQFFTDPNAIRITKNFFRYIVARWGYASNIMSWELFNEIDLNQIDSSIIRNWNRDIINEIRGYDPFNHLISTSTGGSGPEIKHYFEDCDFFNIHKYACIYDTSKTHDLPYALYKDVVNFQNDNKPFFYGEFGYDALCCEGSRDIQLLCEENDPHGFHIHNSLWSSLFSGSMGPASFWWWSKYLKNKPECYSLFNPIFVFTRNLPFLSASFRGRTNGYISDSDNKLIFPNNIEAYYMKNSTNDTIYGWAHDYAFSYLNLRGAVDGQCPYFSTILQDGYINTLNISDRPHPSPNQDGNYSNEIILDVENVPAYTQYVIEWFDAESGERLRDTLGNVVNDRAAVSQSGKLCIEIPSCIRDLRNNRINNIFGDVVFAAYMDCEKAIWFYDSLQNNPKHNVKGEIVCDKNTKQVFYVTRDNMINSIWWNPSTESWKSSNLNNVANNVRGGLAVSSDGTRVFYINNRGNINSIYYQQSTHQWILDEMGNVTNHLAKGPLTVSLSNQVFYVTQSGSLNNVWQDESGTWHNSSLNNAAPSSVGDYLASNSQNEIFYVTRSNQLKAIRYNFSTRMWENKDLNNVANEGVLGPIAITPNGEVFFRTTSYTMNSIKFNSIQNIWQRSSLNNSVTNISHDLNTVGSIIQADVVGKVFYITNSMRTECIYNDGRNWIRFPVGQANEPIKALASNYDGHLFCITGSLIRKQEIQHYLYVSPCQLLYENDNNKELQTIVDDSLYLDNITKKALSSKEKSDIIIYPNPTIGLFTISSKENIESITIYNASGALVKSIKINSKFSSIDLSSCPVGLYYIKICFPNGIFTTQKILINKM